MRSSIFLFLFCSALQGVTQVRLPQLISNGMVLQRDTKLKIWGWASPGEQVHIKFLGKNYQATADNDSAWAVTLPALKAGGPYTMDIDKIHLTDIAIGDVWFCSGQSNMVLNMDRVKEKYPEEIATAEYPLIRNFFVPTLADLAGPRKDLPPGKWIGATPQNVLSFGAASYFFARELYAKYRVPIGIINSSVGGTPIQAWISEAGLKPVPHEAQRAEMFRTALRTIAREAARRGDRAATRDTTQAPAPEMPKAPPRDLGQDGRWFDPAYQPIGWQSYWLPGYWNDEGIRNLNGVVWFRKEVDVPSEMTGRKDSLFLGRIVDADQVYVNGRLIGEVTYQYPPRRYALPDGLLKPGKNLIVVRVSNTAGKGGFVPDKPYYLEAGGEKLDLRGDWQYKVGQVYPPPHAPIHGWSTIFHPQEEPTSLFNTMVAPAQPYAIKGFLWYQGEANAGNPAEYNVLLPALIEDWRAKWGMGKLPFLFVQLPNFMEAQYTPGPSSWAELREAELHALKVPNTGMAVVIDAGEWNDIHPLDKKVVGHRLSLLAEKLAYGEQELAAEGPQYESAEIEGDKIVVRFKNGPLVAHDPDNASVTRGPIGGALAQFTIDGPDGKFAWADAKIEGDSVIVSNPNIKNPVDVRYAWSDNPQDANLYNAAGLPASPFRTDDPYKGDGPWNHKQCAVVLTYDDGIEADLDRVIPALDSVNLKGTFYLICGSTAVINQMDEWKMAAAEGHELGNHSLFHPCDGALPGRNWVTPDNDLSKYTPTRAVNEIIEADAFLQAIDGKLHRTFAYPCGDLTIKGDTFYTSTSLRYYFECARGVTPGLQTADQVDLNNVRCYAIQDKSAEYMINLVKQAGQTHTLLVFLFHGVGGGHSINEGWAQHTALLQYLKAHEKEIWIAPMVEVAQYIRNLR